MEKRIRRFGLKKFGSIKEFAEAMDMSPSNLQAYLQKRRQPGTPILKRLSELGCDIDWLLIGEENNDKRLKIIEEQSQRIKELEKENRILLESINRISSITEEFKKIKNRKDGSKKGSNS
jgi:transcriptional regulator with XRE-family HTH domain